MANVFDQFDTKQKAGNPFDQFDRAEKQKKEPESGFIAGLRSGYERIKGDVGAIGAVAGVEGAEEYAAKQREKAGEIYKQPEFTEHPVDYVTGLLGQSLPYMVAPVVAAAVAPEGAVAIGAAGLASAAQFTGSNISRQLEEGVSAKDAEVVNAMAASVPQAALDIIGFKFMPAISKLFSKAGTPLTEQAATSILGKYILPAAKTAGVEGATESGQQVLERAQAGLSITDPEARKEYFDSFVGGAILGGALSVPGGAIERAQARGRAQPEQEELQQAVRPARETPAEEAVRPTPPAPEAVAPPEEKVAVRPTQAIPEKPAEEQPAKPALPAEEVDALRARAEAPPITEGKYISGEPVEREEVASMKTDAEQLEKERAKLERGEPGKSLWSAVTGKLTPSDIAELGGKKYQFLRAAKDTQARSISELAADGELNDWLPPKLQISKGQQDFLETNPEDELTRAKEADEYIKDKLRQGNYLTYETNRRLEEIGTSLRDIERSYQEINDEEYANSLAQEAVNEQRRIDQEVATAPTEGEARGLEPPTRVYETIPEKPVEEEYFPDQDVLKEEGRGSLAEKLDTKTPQFNQWFGDSKVVDENKNPKVMYHTTSADFDTFDTTKRAIGGEGSYFSDIPTRGYGEEGEQVIPVYLSLKNPKVIDLMRQNDDVLKSKFIEQGHDGVIMMRDGKIVTAVAFYPEQIKSVFNKRPTGKPGILEEREKFVINKDPEFERIEKELTGKTMLQVSQWAVDNAPNQFAKAIAQKVMNRLNGMASRGIKMEFEIVTGERRPARMYNARGLVDFDFGRPSEGKQPTFKLTINGAPVMDNQGGYPPGARYITVLHELLHVATVGQINILKSDDPIVKDLRDLFNKVVTHFNTEVRAGRLTAFMEKMYSRQNNALASPDELLAWGMSDKEMQEFLSEIKVGDQTIMDKLVELIRKILNVTKPYLTALDQLVKTTESILDEDVDVVGDKIIAKQYSFGVKPGMGEAVQGSLFEKEGKQTSAQIAKAAANKALQKRKLPKSQFEGVDDQYYEELKRIFAPEKKTIIDKIDGMRDGFWQRLAQGVADQYRTIKDYSNEAYMKARMSKTVDGALDGLLFNGRVKLTDGALDIMPKTDGLMKVLEPVGNEVDRYQIWAALTRDAQLVKDGKAPSVNKDLVAERDQLSSGKIGDKSRLQVYKEVQRGMKKLNGSVLGIALRQGIIDVEAYKVYRRDINYIPFYKMMDEDSDVQSVATKSGLVNQYFTKELKGGEKPFGDLMENTLRNWSHILSASMKNEAANATVEAAMDMGAAFPNLKVGLEWKTDEDGTNGKVYSSRNGKLIGDLKPQYTTSGKGTVKTMIDGKPAYFDISRDPLLLESILSIGYMGPKSKFLDVSRNFKNMLQFGVTLSPAFKVRNLFRDSISAMAVSGLKKNPFANVVEGWAASDRNNPAHISALAGGGIFNFGSAVEGDQAKLVKRLLDKGVKQNTILDSEDKIKKNALYLWDKYQEWGNKSESVNRIALYKQLRESGFSHLEASFQARDMLDFSMQGAWPAFRYLTQIVPFLNARVQGLYKLGRDGINPTSRAVYSLVTGKDLWGDTEQGKKNKLTDQQKAQQFSVVMGAVALASLALYMAFKDDEEFKKREEWDRDNFWWFKLPGMNDAFRIPKPFEVGAFGTLAERTAEQIFDQGAEGKAFEKSMKRMLTDTFAINLPQIFKPLVDLYANKDSFTGAPIETAGMERLSKDQRIAEKTSPLAIALSKVTNVFLPESAEVSPVQTDYAIKAYFGWLGGTSSWLSHYAVQPFSKSAYPDNDWKETLSMGFVKTLPTTQSKYVTAFYENNKEISQAFADMRHFAELGEADKVQEILKEKGDKIAMAKFYDKASKDMSKIRQVILHIRADENMTGAQKKEEIDRLKIIIGKIAEQMEDARLAVKKQYAASR